MTALQSLQTTNRDLLRSQQRISTGFRISTAEENPAYWSIATSMRTDNKSLSTVRDALGLGMATVDVAYTAMDSSIDVATEIKVKLVAARETGVDRAVVNREIAELQNQLRSIASSATFSGQNWLSVNSSETNHNAQRSVVASLGRASDGSVTFNTITVDTSGTKLFDASASAVGILDGLRDANGDLAASGFSVVDLSIATLSESAADQATLDSYIAGVDKAITAMTNAATSLGTMKQRITLQTNIVSSLIDVIERGISTLVDSDMNEESTKLQAYQVQQQLGTQALNAANGSSQSILSLFRN